MAKSPQNGIKRVKSASRLKYFTTDVRSQNSASRTGESSDYFGGSQNDSFISDKSPTRPQFNSTLRMGSPDHVADDLYLVE